MNPVGLGLLQHCRVRIAGHLRGRCDCHFIAPGLHWAAIALFTIAFIVFRVFAKIFAVGRHLINLKLIISLIKKFKYGSFNQ